MSFDADAFMQGRDWAKWADCREMVEEAYAQGRRDAAPRGAVTVTLPGLDPSHAKDLVNMALAEWRRTREAPMYVDKRYGHMPEPFRARRLERLEKELAALDQLDLNVLNF